MRDSRIQDLNRRDALKLAGAAFGTLVIGRTARAAQTSATPDGRPRLCLFSKILHNRPFKDLPGLLPKLGVDALDLTCRAGGHVLPEQAGDDLPAAFEALKAADVAVPMISTDITDAGQGNAETIVRTAAKLGIRYAKLGYYPYKDLGRIHETLADVKARLRDVAALFQQYQVQAGFHNHSGQNVGAPMWDLWQLIADLPPAAVGSYFDTLHATVEGGGSAWKIGLNLLAPRIVMLAVKDFRWEKDARRGWNVRVCPLGEGMVRVEEVVARLKPLGFAGPVSLHIEYGDRQPAVGSNADEANMAAIRKDWGTLNGLLHRTFEA